MKKIQITITIDTSKFDAMMVQCISGFAWPLSPAYNAMLKALEKGAREFSDSLTASKDLMAFVETMEAMAKETQE